MLKSSQPNLRHHDWIYHIAERTLWEASQISGQYEPENFKKEGFIHCSSREQIERVASFYYSGRRALLLLEINPELVASEIKWEGEGPHKFPHIYGALAVHAVVRTIDWEPNGEGVFVFPFENPIH